MARIIVGTSGYSYDDWRGVFYPEELKKSDFLRYYAGEFNGVEINFTYYSFPSQGTLARMADITPANFVFSVKANQIFTHERNSNALLSVEKFLYGIAPLRKTEKLEAILFQFPYSFHYNDDNRIYLNSLIKKFKEEGGEKLPLAIEFRNTDWARESVTNRLREMNVALVNVDLPKLSRLPLPGGTVTSDIAYIRFHGRNSKNWWKGDNTSRYDYLYSREELEEWLPLIDRVLNHVQILLLFFNNHHKGKAVLNARMMREMLM